MLESAAPAGVRRATDMMDSSPTRSLVVSSRRAGGGKTHVACALSRWLSNQGCRAVPLHLSGGDGGRIARPGAGRISRSAALLAEACRLAPEPLFESSLSRLAELEQMGDAVIVEAGWELAVQSALPLVEVEMRAGELRVNGCPVQPFTPAVTHAPAAELEGLPEWDFLGRPRVGVVSLPHLLEFRDLALLQGAEWLTAAGVGQFDFVVVPATSNPAPDAGWLEETGLLDWLEEQARGGATVVSCGWEVGGARRMERGDLTDYRRLSMLLGRRLSAPLPDDEVLERMAEWIAPWARQEKALEGLY